MPDSKRPDRSTRVRSARSAEPAAGAAGAGKTRGADKVDSEAPVRAIRRPSENSRPASSSRVDALERAPESVASNPSAGRELLSVQAATAGELTGPVNRPAGALAGIFNTVSEAVESGVSGIQDFAATPAGGVALSLLTSPPAQAEGLSEGAGVSGQAEIASEMGGFGGFLDSALGSAANFQADIQSGVTDAVGSTAGGLLDRVGAHGAADQVRAGTEQASESFQEQAALVNELGLSGVVEQAIPEAREEVGRALDGAFNGYLDVQAGVQSGISDAIGSAAGGFLDRLGAHGLAENVRSHTAQTSESIQENAEFLAEQGLGASLAQAFDEVGNIAGDVVALNGRLSTQAVEAVSSVGTSALEQWGEQTGDVLEQLGATGLANGVRAGTETAAEVIQAGVEFQAGVVEDNFIGIGAGVNSIVTGLGGLVSNPVGTAEGLVNLQQATDILGLPIEIIRNGGDVEGTLRDRTETLTAVGQGIIEPVLDTYEEHGLGAAVAHAGFEILTSINLGGAAAGGRGASGAVRLSDDVAGAAHAVDNLSDIRRPQNGAGAADNARPGSGAGLLDDLPPGVRQVDDASAARILDRTEVDNFRGTDFENADFNRLSPARLDELGLGPRYQVNIGNRNVTISEPYRIPSDFPGGPTATGFVAYIEDANGVVRPRTFYQSNSGGTFRTPSNTNSRGSFGKSTNEDFTNLPIELQEQLSDLVQRGDVRDLPDGIGRDVAFGGQPQGIDVLDELPFNLAQDEPITIGRGDTRQNLSGQSHVDPDSFQYSSPGQAPAFEGGPAREFEVPNPSGGDPIQARSFTSQDGSLEYLYFTHPDGGTWLGQIDNLDSPINEFGVRSQPVDAQGLTTPAAERFNQAPQILVDNGLQRPAVDSLVDVTAYTEALPPVRDYLAWLGSL